MLSLHKAQELVLDILELTCNSTEPKCSREAQNHYTQTCWLNSVARFQRTFTGWELKVSIFIKCPVIIRLHHRLQLQEKCFKSWHFHLGIHFWLLIKLMTALSLAQTVLHSQHLYVSEFICKMTHQNFPRRVRLCLLNANMCDKLFFSTFGARKTFWHIIFPKWLLMQLIQVWILISYKIFSKGL